jgi:protein SCO1/2
MNSPTLAEIKRTGHAPLPEGGPTPRVMDVMQPGDVVPDVPLTDQSAKTVRFSDWRGQVLAVTFVYTRCPLPDFCPRMDRNFSSVRRSLDADPALRDRVHLVSVSFDPERDTPAVLRAHANTLGADPRSWSYVTGTPDAIATLASRFGVSTIRESDPASTITHNLRTAIVDGAGRLVSVRSGNDWTPEALLQDIRARARR